ncbi:uncharacterized protein IAS62_003797 [Cryptococcus decagattii]|uniref:Uncharacterized protein n=1 Tax=Cryptococcus decagattii TaxID=1859122 RepID=A0ABZ2AVP2_9TREE
MIFRKLCLDSHLPSKQPDIAFKLQQRRLPSSASQAMKENKKKRAYTAEKRQELLEKAKRTLQGDGAVMLLQNPAALAEYCQILMAFRACLIMHKSRTVLPEWRRVLKDAQEDLRSATASHKEDLQGDVSFLDFQVQQVNMAIRLFRYDMSSIISA